MGGLEGIKRSTEADGWGMLGVLSSSPQDMGKLYQTAIRTARVIDVHFTPSQPGDLCGEEGSQVIRLVIWSSNCLWNYSCSWYNKDSYETPVYATPTWKRNLNWPYALKLKFVVFEIVFWGKQLQMQLLQLFLNVPFFKKKISKLYIVK